MNEQSLLVLYKVLLAYSGCIKVINIELLEINFHFMFTKYSNMNLEYLSHVIIAYTRP